MRRRSTRKAPASTSLSSPAEPSPPRKTAAVTSPTPSPAESPPVKFGFNLDGFDDIAPKTKSNNRGIGGSSNSKLSKSAIAAFSPSPTKSLKSASSISDLKDLASSNLDAVKRHMERSHSEIVKDFEASQCRLQKRYKMQSQACQQVMDEAEKEYKKVSERINEGREAMKASYSEFIAEAQATGSRLSKTSLPVLSQTFEKGIASLRSRYGIRSTAH